jgi:hypothetical protein
VAIFLSVSSLVSGDIETAQGLPRGKEEILRSKQMEAMMDGDGMLFVAHWTHTPENCPGRSNEGATMLNDFWAKRDLAAKKGAKILGAYVAVTEHTYYIIIQAKDYQSMLEFFEPLAPTQTGGIHPVTTMEEWTKHINPKSKG